VIRSKLSRSLTIIAGAVVLGCMASAQATGHVDRSQRALTADSNVTDSRHLPGRDEDDDVCTAGVIDRSDCSVEDKSGSAADAKGTTDAPESQTYALMLAGLGAAGFLARRRQPLRH
jgi:hypothetical protein